MEGFDAASFWAGLGLGLVNGIALACFTRAWRWAGLPPSGAGRPYNVNPPAPSGAGRPYNVNPPAPANIRPEVAPKAPPPTPAKRHHLTVELRQRPPRGPYFGPEPRR